MSRVWMKFGVVAVFAAHTWAAWAQAPAVVNWDAIRPGENAAAGELIVIYKDSAVKKLPRRDNPMTMEWEPPLRVSVTHSKAGARVAQSLMRVPAQRVLIPAAGGIDAMKAAAAVYAADPDVLAVEPNYFGSIYQLPNDPYGMVLWGLDAIGATNAWQETTGSRDIVVAVVDTGVGEGGIPGHEDLDANLWANPGEIPGNGVDDDGNGLIDDVYGWNFIESDGDPSVPYDRNSHGTHCAGTIGAVGNNGTGVVGVNWEVSIVGVKSMDNNGGGTVASLAGGIEYVAWFDGKEGRPRIHLSNHSWGVPWDSTLIRRAVELTRDAGHLLIAAAGNDTVDNDVVASYPANYDYDNIISVASLARHQAGDGTVSYALSDFSNFGLESVDLAAPGSLIVSTVPQLSGLYGVKSGTSMAAPHVSGAAALLYSVAPNARYYSIRRALMDAARMNPLEGLEDKTVTGGMLYLPTALDLLARMDVYPHTVTNKAFGPPGGGFSGFPFVYEVALPKEGTRAEISVTVDQPWVDLWVEGVNHGQAYSGWWDGSVVFDVVAQTNAATLLLDYSFDTPYQADIVFTDLTHAAAGMPGTVMTKTILLKVSDNYVLQSAPFEWIEAAAPAPVTDFAQPIQLPFDFTYFDKVYTQMWVNANGMISLEEGVFPAGGNVALPEQGSEVALICPYWDDLVATNVRQRVSVTVDAAGSHVAVTWRDVKPADAGDDACLEFQAVLYPASSTGEAPTPGGNDIRFNYRHAAQDDDAGAGRQATIGLQDDGAFGAREYTVDGVVPEILVYPDPDPAVATPVVYTNEPMVLADNQSLLFTWRQPKPDTREPEVVFVQNLLIYPGYLDLDMPGLAVFEVRFNEIVLGLATNDFVFSPDSVAGATVTRIDGGGERFIVTVENFYDYGRISIGLPGGTVFDLADNLNAASDWYRAVVPYSKLHMLEDFETGIGEWTVSTNVYEQVTTDVWQYGTPAHAAAGPLSGADGSANCWGTVLDAYCPRGTEAWLESPPLYLGKRPILDFRYWAGMNAWYDEAWIELSIGKGWEPVQWLPVSSGGEWARMSFVLPERYENETVCVRFRIRTSQSYGVNIPGLYIDNFRVMSVQPPGLYLIGAETQPLAPDSQLQLTTHVYNSMDTRIEFAGGFYGSADSALAVETTGYVFYGAMEPGDIVAHEFVSVTTKAASAFASSSVVLTHAGYDNMDYINASEASLAVDTTPVARPKTFRAYTTTGVFDALGEPLKGDGGPRSMIFQVIYAGGNGIADAPGADGETTGDDQVLYTYHENQPFGRFGANRVSTDLGLFSRMYMHNLPAGAKVYVRAWDAETFERAVAYGDSELYTLAAADEQEHDFGTWVVDSPAQYYRDSNGDGIPDGWAIAIGRDPRESNGALVPSATETMSTLPDTTVFLPRRAIYNGTHVFAVIREKSATVRGQVQVWNADLSQRLSMLDTITTGGKTYTFDPVSLCFSPDGGKLYVATAGQTYPLKGTSTVLGGRILTFTVNGSTLAYESVHPALNADGFNPSFTGCFNQPKEVVCLEDGSLLVVDQYTGFRIQQLVLGANPAASVWANVTLLASNDKPVSMTYDADYVYVGSSLAGAGKVVRISRSAPWQQSLRFGGSLNVANGLSIGLGGYFYVAEMNAFDGSGNYNGTLHIYTPDGQLAASYTGLDKIEGVFADTTTPYHRVLITEGPDHGNDGDGNCLRWLDLLVDADGDGIDDIWECHHFGSTEACDPWDDPDGDGLTNLGEYRAGTDPDQFDTNGNGAGDQWDMMNGTDPVAPGATVPDSTLDNLPEVVTIIGDPATAAPGESVVVTVTFNMDVTAETLLLTWPDGQVVRYPLSGSGSVYQAVVTVPEGMEGGVVGARASAVRNAGFHSMEADPSSPLQDAFTVLRKTPTLPIIITAFSVYPFYIQWTAEEGISYWLLTSTDLATWVLLEGTGEFVGGTGGFLDYTDTTMQYPDPARFYRVTSEDPAP